MLLAAAVNGTPLYADSSETPRKAGDLAFWEELAYWESIKGSKDPSEFEAYLLAYPQGRFARLAELRVKALKSKAEPESTAVTAPSASGGGELSEGTQAGTERGGVGGSDGTAGDAAELSPGTMFRDCDECPLMVVVPAGRYPMGSELHRPDEKPRHEINFARPFAIGVHEATIREWDACLREGGCRFSPAVADDDRLPASNLSWDDAQGYVAWLRDKTGEEYRLPTETEWEYAASGGKTTRFWWGDEVGKGNANCSDCGSAGDGQGPIPVGSFESNPFGLYDVHGNLWEWTMDCVNRSYKDAPTDGSAWLRGDCIPRILRGGSWKLGSDYMRTTRRYHYDRDVRYYLHGFRVVRPLELSR
jgi:formylglycine-generating enzyme required for sulfatase activity